MPRANRHYQAGQVWHITHRCHQRDFLLKFARDRRRWRYWLFRARRRFGLCVLNDIVTSNHVHLLGYDRGMGEISRGLQLTAGRTAQEYNRRKQRKGAFWEDRYHATAVESGDHLARCLTYIDLNRVRAGAVAHPGQWPDSGYCELQAPPQRYGIVDHDALITLLDLSDLPQLQQERRQWVDQTLADEPMQREGHWSESLAVGSKAFVTAFQHALGARTLHRSVDCCSEGSYAWRPPLTSRFFPRKSPAKAKKHRYQPLIPITGSYLQWSDPTPGTETRGDSLDLYQYQLTSYM